uniref:MyTH4 domain-containing protein n=1 Tax=Pelusios castaneus TaxID=367368 RepID=A0A8C8RYJ1_9SAUR
MDVGLLEIPAELAALLHSAKGQHHVQANQITEVSPPEVKAKCDLSLPPDTNNSPFSSFIRSHFQEPDFPALGQLLQQPLTRLQGEDKRSALEINKLILRFIGDRNLQSWQEVLVGNYIASRGLSNVALRNEIFSQVVSQLWKNPDPEENQRACALMTTLLCAFPPSPVLEKPLLRFVSDHIPEGYNAVCQRKILTAMRQTEMDPKVSRAYPPTLLEWTANQRKGKMVLDVLTYNDERVSAEVESWTTGEQYTGWILNSRGLEKDPRGWSISLLRGEVWWDLPGCDFVLDLIGEMEEAGSPSQGSSDYPITPKWDETLSQGASLDMEIWDIPPAPSIQAPSLPPPFLPPSVDVESTYSGPGARSIPKSPGGLEHYVDNLFDPVLHQGSRVPDMESGEDLTGRMKGGGKIGPAQQGTFPSVGYPGMMQMPAYQPMPMMGGMVPAPIPMMPGLGGIAPVPAMVAPQQMVPAMDPSQLAAQQAFITQQAQLMAQQMTLQAITMSQQQQQRSPESRIPRRALTPPPAPAHAPAAAPKPKRSNSSKNAAPAVETQAHPPDAAEPTSVSPEEQLTDSDEDSDFRSSFRQKMEYFQKMGEQKIQVKKVRPSSKKSKAKANSQQEEKEQERPSPESEKAPPPPPTQKVKDKKEKKEPQPGVATYPAPKREPSREIRNIIKMYQSRPAPEPQPIELARKPIKSFVKKRDPRNEALAKLGMAGAQSPKSTSPERSPKGGLLPPPGKKGLSASSTIREKQQPIMHLFAQSSTSPPNPPSAPALPPSLLSADQPMQQSELRGSARTLAEEEASIKTQLYKHAASVSFSYASMPWKIILRKEVWLFAWGCLLRGLVPAVALWRGGVWSTHPSLLEVVQTSCSGMNCWREAARPNGWRLL